MCKINEDLFDTKSKFGIICLLVDERFMNFNSKILK